MHSLKTASRSSAVRTVTLPGGHHFGGGYERIAEALLADLATRNPATSGR
jgi:type IV secretory pathway VirJ component